VQQALSLQKNDQAQTDSHGKKIPFTIPEKTEKEHYSNQ